MPSINNYMKLIYVNLGFIGLISIMVYLRSITEIKKNWAQYRCNPPYWIFSDNISEDFTYCVQNTQMNLMGYLLKPITQVTSSLTDMGGNITQSVDDTRGMISNIRDYTSDITVNTFSVFSNLIIEIQKISIGVKDMVGKLIGIVVTMMYIMEGSIKTMDSAWSGPTGQVVRKIGSIKLGSCFHPETKVQLQSGEIYPMKDLPLGSILSDGSIVYSVMKISNLNHKDKLYTVSNNKGDPIYVTGSHYILDKKTDKFIQVKDSDAVINDITCDWFSCLITTTGKIPIGEHIFWDWEDDELLYSSNDVDRDRDNIHCHFRKYISTI